MVCLPSIKSAYLRNLDGQVAFVGHDEPVAVGVFQLIGRLGAPVAGVRETSPAFVAMLFEVVTATAP